MECTEPFSRLLLGGLPTQLPSFCASIAVGILPTAMARVQRLLGADDDLAQSHVAASVVGATVPEVGRQDFAISKELPRVWGVVQSHHPFSFER